MCAFFNDFALMFVQQYEIHLKIFICRFWLWLIALPLFWHCYVMFMFTLDLANYLSKREQTFTDASLVMVIRALQHFLTMNSRKHVCPSKEFLNKGGSIVRLNTRKTSCVWGTYFLISFQRPIQANYLWKISFKCPPWLSTAA